MAHLWEMGKSDGWFVRQLYGSALELSLGPAGTLSESTPSADSPGLALLRVGGEADGVWALVSPHDTGVTINGSTVCLGLVILSDRDEIRIPGGPPLFFSTETLPHVALFPATDPRGFCPRCKQHIEPDTPAVRCPACGLWHHASDDLPCWTYGDKCAACPQPTSLDGGFRWTPEEL